MKTWELLKELQEEREILEEWLNAFKEYKEQVQGGRKIRQEIEKN